MTVTVEDDNRIPELLKELKYLENAVIKVGIFAPEGSELFVKAHVNEYGAQIKVTDAMRGYLWWKGMNIGKDTKYINIPERSYLRSTFDEEEKDIVKQFENGIQDIMDGKKTAKQLLQEIGLDLERAVKEKIKNIDSPPNHPFTVKQKGSSSPLIDKGSNGLRQNIEYRIE